MGRNAHKSTFVRGSLPNIFEGEDRRFQQCEQPFIVLASVEDGSMYKNDVTHVFQNVILSGDTVTISIEKNGQVLSNRGTSVFYPNSPNAVGFIFDWRQYLQNEGAGCYTIKLACVLAGVQVDFTWGNYELSPWTIDSAMNTVRVYSRFNSYALNHNIDFSGSNAVDSIRFNGFFGNMQPNTKVNNLKANNNVQSKVTRENLKTYELTSDLLNVCHTKRLIDLHFLHENDVWISDHNPQNHTYEYRDIEVIVKEVPDIEYPKDVRGAVVKCVFEDKQPYYKSRYRISSPLGDVTPSPTCDDGTVNVNKSDGVLISAVTVTSGGTEPYNVADSTAVLKDTAGTTISTTSIKATESEDITAPDTTLQVNGVTEGTHVAGSTIDIQLSDGTNPVTPVNVTVVGDVVTVEVEKPTICWSYFSIKDTTTANIRMTTISGDDFIVDWGDGTVVTYASAHIDRTHTYSSPYSGVVKITAVNGLSDVNQFRTTVGGWNFDIALLNQLPNLDRVYFSGNNITVTGDIAALSNVTDLVYFIGNNITVTGDIAALSNVSYRVYFIGNNITVTGDIAALSNVTNTVYFNGSQITATYTPTTWQTIPILRLQLAPNHLTTSTEVDNLLIDFNNTGASGNTTIDLRYNNAPRTSASDTAVTELTNRGYTVLTN